MRILALAVLGLALAAATVSPGSRAADECRGLQVCIPVEGPWVVIPASKGIAMAEWELKCPVGVVAGLDARATNVNTSVRFSGRLGSPVNPGITTVDRVVFVARYTGADNKPTAFRPFIGCVPVRGGGRRTPTSASAFVPGEPITLRVESFPVYAGALSQVEHSCLPGERMLRTSYAVGLYTKSVPTPAQRVSVHVVAKVVENQIVASATRHGLARNIRAEVQVLAECAR